MIRNYLLIGLVLSYSFGTLGHTHAVAQATETSVSAVAFPTNDWSFWPDNDDQAPERTVSGASRDSCSDHQTTALVPTSQYGFTSKYHPEVLVATTPETPRKALFTVQSETGYYYETYIELPGVSGITGINIPEDAPALTANELYQWSLIMMCNQRLRPDSPTIYGWIQIQPGDYSSESSISLEQAVTYRNNYLWYDMVSVLAKLRRQEPNNQTVYAAWQSMLSGANLGSVADVPILE